MCYSVINSPDTCFAHAQEAHKPQSGNYWKGVTQATLDSDGNFIKYHTNDPRGTEVSLDLCNICIPAVNI